jgi:hypothetical protein
MSKIRKYSEYNITIIDLNHCSQSIENNIINLTKTFNITNINSKDFKRITIHSIIQTILKESSETDQHRPVIVYNNSIRFDRIAQVFNTDTANVTEHVLKIIDNISKYLPINVINTNVTFSSTLSGEIIDFLHLIRTKQNKNINFARFKLYLQRNHLKFLMDTVSIKKILSIFNK